MNACEPVFNKTLIADKTRLERNVFWRLLYLYNSMEALGKLWFEPAFLLSPPPRKG